MCACTYIIRVIYAVVFLVCLYTCIKGVFNYLTSFFFLTLFNRISDVSHCVCAQLNASEREAAAAACRHLWQLHFPMEQYDLDTRHAHGTTTAIHPMWRADERPTVSDFLADRKWYREYCASISGNGIVGDIDDSFLRRCQLGYQRFMYLMAKSPRALERTNFAPPPPIDLFWHTHLAQPSVYGYGISKFSLLIRSCSLFMITSIHIMICMCVRLLVRMCAYM